MSRETKPKRAEEQEATAVPDGELDDRDPARVSGGVRGGDEDLEDLEIQRRR